VKLVDYVTSILQQANILNHYMLEMLKIGLSVFN